jgi:pyruvate,orthophosphate dikinase
VRSEALEVNLRRTDVEVVIPEDHRILLEITEPFYGVREETHKLLQEIHHRYVGWPRTLQDLRRRAMGDFYYYNRHARGSEGLAVFSRLFAKAVTGAEPVGLRDGALASWLAFLEKIVCQSGDRLERNLPVVADAVRCLAALLKKTPDLAVGASPRLRKLVRSLQAAGVPPGDDSWEHSLRLLASSLDRVYSYWLAREDPAAWCRAPAPDASDPLARISHAGLGASREQVRRLPPVGPLDGHAAELLELPDNRRLVRDYLEAVSAAEAGETDPVERLLKRSRWFSRILAQEALAPVHEQALREMSRSCSEVLRHADGAQLRRFLDDLFVGIRRGGFQCQLTVLELVRKIGQEVFATGKRAWIELLLDEVLRCDFHYPEFSGFTEEWGVHVNPAHLKNIRVYLDLIALSPSLAHRLLAALIVHLRIGGVFVADTDLFQKDISALLASDIGEAYHEVKYLLKLFPVYFSDIGAEGELRDVSTRIDEITGRRDRLCHFLRKQSHVESNPLLGPFIDAIAVFWATGDREPLRPYVPATLLDQIDPDDPQLRPVREIFAALAPRGRTEALFALPPEALERRLDEAGAGESIPREKTRLLVRMRRAVDRKYALDHTDLLERLRTSHDFDAAQVAALESALLEERHETAAEILLDMLERLKAIILSPEPTEAVEDIYHKRHIAVGIPSMYGRYRETKFEALGLSYRIESLVTVLFERLAGSHDLRYISMRTLQRVARWLRLMLRALRVDGCRGRGLGLRLSMLEGALEAPGVTVDQHINIFQLLSRSIEGLIRIRFLETYDPVLGRMMPRMIERGVLGDGNVGREEVLKYSETFLRDAIAESFGLQPLDNLVGKILHALIDQRETLDRTTLDLLMTYDVNRCFVPIAPAADPRDGVTHLGNKGFMLKRLVQLGFPVPHGFILTTEVFRCRTALHTYEQARAEEVARIREQIARLERLTHARFGDRRNPLLLSVRAGAAISMPGMLTSFLNVGINPEIAEGIAAAQGSPWAAWDAYRRILQMWGMSHGIERDRFDELMLQSKQEHAVPKKALLPPAAMREVASRYHQLLRDHGVEFPDDPHDQLESCIDLVLRSWDSDNARLYRRELKIADAWGTAVIVQGMVYGNLHDRAGTGVVLTCHPRKRGKGAQLYGDFIIQGQGEDVVSGLVETFPITEQQRLAESPEVSHSLETRFPRIHAELDRLARSLVEEHGMEHQEVEFTFEGERPEDLYILQSRDVVLGEYSSIPAFVPTAKLERARVATGIGAGGGALSGRAAYTEEQIVRLQESFGDDPIILLRPDTVPDDIHLVLQADGLLTAVGGATSHAAVAAQRLGKTCVVGCRKLEVHDEEGRFRLAGRAIPAGAFVSINGLDGSVYLGKHPVRLTPVAGYQPRPSAYGDNR